MPERTESVLAPRSSQAPTGFPGCVIRVTEGDDAGTQVELVSGEALIGTKPDCRLRLSDPTISGHHAKLEVVSNGILVTDLGSKNGTHYLGGRLERAVLQPGAVLHLGRSRLLLSSRQPQDGAAYSSRDGYGPLTGASVAMRRLYAILEQIEPVDYTALILGETGVGKEQVARAIHSHSRRANAQFEVCDCASLSPTLIESELFGHVRGAYTGADSSVRGVFERANGGTIFLDEIGELPLALQPRLLRVLETRTVHRLGAEQTVPIDVRVIAATNRNLDQAIRAGQFRQDLYFRLNLVTIEVPPLRERREDIPSLVRELLAQMGDTDVELTPLTLELFTSSYDWPGNVRELKNAVARIRALGAVPAELNASQPLTTPPATAAQEDTATFQEAKRRLVEAFERDFLAAKLTQCGNNISRAAQAAGLERNQFKRLLRKHGLLAVSDEA